VNRTGDEFLVLSGTPERVTLSSIQQQFRSKQVADWVLARATSRGGADFELLDLADFELPLLDEPMPPSLFDAASLSQTIRS
jgi:NAD(P)H-dependent FMN reductase